MADDRLDRILERLERLERRIEQLEGTQPTGTVLPPPVIRTPVKRSLEALTRQSVGGIKPQPQHLKPRPKEPEQEPAAKTQKEDGEFVFGSKVLPIVGIVIVLLAISYLVVLGIQRGWITPTVQFIGELTLCGALIGVGFWKINELEDFGPKLVAGGSVGLYLSFAGAHVYKDLYGGAVLVGLFAALSLANLAFSWWRSSKSFWMIGFVGGLVAAGLPMDRSDYAASLVLAAIIVAAATALAAHRKWFKAIGGLWLVSSAFVMVVVQIALSKGAMDVAAAMALFYAFSFVPIGGYALSLVSNKFDDRGWFLLIAGGLTSVATLMFGDDILPAPHSVGILFWSAALLALGGAIRERPQSQMLLLTAVGTATVIAPIGFTAFSACLTYAGLGLAATALAHVWKREGLERAAAIFSVGYLVLSVAAYAIAMSAGSVATSTELTMLAAVAVGLANVAVVAGRLEKNMSAAVTVGSVLLYPILARSAYVLAETEPLYAVLFTQSLYAIVLAIVALRARWQGVGVVGMFVTAASAFIYWALATDTGHAVTTGRLILVLGVMTAGLLTCALGAGRDKTEKQIATVIAAALGTVIVVPMFGLVLGLPRIGMENLAAVVASLSIYAALLACASLRVKWPGYSYVGSAVTLGALAVYWSEAVQRTATWSTADQILLVSMLGAALGLSALGSGRDRKELQTAAVLASIAGWFVFARFLYLLLVLPAVGMAEQAALTTSWSVYAALVLTFGFVFDFKNLRITGLVMFGVTIAKVFLVDLAELDDLVKVLVLLVLGFVILGGGYLYVRARNAREDAS